MPKKKQTAWLDVEMERGTASEIASIDMDCSSTPTINVTRDRRRICTMEFPADQKDMKSPFTDMIVKALAVIMLEGLTPNQRRALEVATPELTIFSGGLR